MNYDKIELYLTHVENIEIYNAIAKCKYIEPVKFFKKLYREFQFFTQFSEEYLTLFNYYDVNNIFKRHQQRYSHETRTIRKCKNEWKILNFEIQLANALLKLISNEYKFSTPNEVRNQSINLLKLHETESERCLRYMFDELQTIDNAIECIEDFVFYLDDLDDIDEKIEVVLKLKYKFLQSPYFIKKYDRKKFIVFCDLELEKLQELRKLYRTETNNKLTITEKYNYIFSNNGYTLWNHILEDYVKPKGKKGRYSDIAFFYWALYNNEKHFIHQRPERFKQWFYETYEEDIGKIKTFDIIKNADRIKHYSNALEWFKSQ